MAVENLKDFFASIGNTFVAEAWGDRDAVLLFDISGGGGGKWTVTIAGGKATVAEGQAGEPITTVMCSDADLLAMINGELNPVSAFMQGKVKIGGDMSVAMKLQGLLSG
jgi:putative sterol carrier protein